MGNIKIGKITMGMYQTNCYFLYREGSKDVIVVDPADSGDYLYDKLYENGFLVKAILLTHGHFDHIYGVKALKRKSEAKVYALDKEAELLSDVKLNCSMSVGRGEMIVPDELLRDKDKLTLCDMTFEVIATPGHTAGSACFYFEEAGILVAGDTLFCESIGRSDLPTGNGRQLINSIKERLLVLDDSVRVYPGHGESTTIGNERTYNPFLD